MIDMGCRVENPNTRYETEFSVRAAGYLQRSGTVWCLGSVCPNMSRRKWADSENWHVLHPARLDKRVMDPMRGGIRRCLDHLEGPEDRAKRCIRLTFTLLV